MGGAKYRGKFIQLRSDTGGDTGAFSSDVAVRLRGWSWDRLLRRKRDR